MWHVCVKYIIYIIYMRENETGKREERTGTIELIYAHSIEKVKKSWAKFGKAVLNFCLVERVSLVSSAFSHVPA